MVDLSVMSLKKRLEQERALIPRVAQIWQVPEQGQNDWNTLTLIIKSMQNEHVARSVWEALAPDERLCLFYLLESGDPAKAKGITLESLGKQTRLPSGKVEEAVESLRTRWYLVERTTPSVLSSAKSKSSRQAPVAEQVILPYRECFEPLWQIGQEIFQRDEDRSILSLERLVETYTGDQLYHLAMLCHVPMYYGMYPYNAFASSSTSVLQEIHHRIAEALSHPPMPFELLNQLEPLTQEIFFLLCEQGGKVQMTEVRSYIAARTQAQGAFLSVISMLESCALAFDTFTGDGTRWLFTPAELLTRVEHEVQERAEEEQRFVFCPGDETEAGQESQPLLLYDLAAVIGISTQMIIEPTKDGRVPKRLRGKIRPLLHGRARIGGDSLDDIYIDQIFRTAHRMGLLEVAAPAEEEKRRYLRGPRLGSWSDLGPIEQAQAFLHWWRTTPHWADVRSDDKLLYSSTIDHEQLLNQLKHCVPERWYRMEVLFYALFRERPLPFFPSYTQAFVRPTPLRSQWEIWMEREAETYRGPLTSFLSELGIVSVKQQPQAAQEGTEDLFCITAFGAAVLETIPVPPDPPTQAVEQPALILQPNFEVLVMSFDTRLVYQLLPTAELLGIGRVSTFRLTQSALLTGLRNGVHLEELLTFLAAHTPQKTLPQNVVYTLKDWAKTYREFRLSEAFLIETPENETADSLRRLLGNLPLELRQIEPGNFLVLPRTHLTFGDLRKRLRKAGIEVQGEPLSV
jgi:hypothetical protein